LPKRSNSEIETGSFGQADSVLSRFDRGTFRYWSFWSR